MSNIRSLSGANAVLARLSLVLLVLIGIADILNLPLYFGIAYYRVNVLAPMFGLASIYTFMTYAPRRRAEQVSKVPWYDWLLVALSVAANGYIAVMYGTLSQDLSAITPLRILVGAVSVALCLEMVRRAVGMILVLTAVVFILYAHYSAIMPDVIYARASGWDRVLTFIFFDPSGLFGLALDTILGVVLAFILFGNLLFATGGGQFVTNIAMRLVGRLSGGPAKMSVVASSLFGTMTGSAAANVVFCGIITIPLMKKVGYRPAFAGAVEAVAASGGCLMPPVMGAAAFIMAEFLNVPYSEVALGAAVPAILYYICVYMQVHFEAKRHALQPLREEDLPPLDDVWRGAILFCGPLALLVYFLFVMNLPAQTSVMYATGGLLLLVAAAKPQLLRFKTLWDVLHKTGSDLIQMILIAGLAGLILGVVTLKGLGSTLSQALVLMSGHNLWVLLALTAAACIVLGMGLPAVPIYILLAVLVAPALVKFGIDPLSAHLFIYYFGIMSYVTPPMAFACFVSGPMAGANPFSTGIQGMRLSIVAYIVPFMFVLHPELLLHGRVIDIVFITIASSAAAVLLAAAVSGYMIRPLHLIERGILAIGALLLFLALKPTIIAAVCIFTAMAIWLYRSRPKAAASLASR